MEWLVALVLAAALVAVGRLAVLRRRRATELGVENARWRARLVAACLTHP